MIQEVIVSVRIRCSQCPHAAGYEIGVCHFCKSCYQEVVADLAEWDHLYGVAESA